MSQRPKEWRLSLPSICGASREGVAAGWWRITVPQLCRGSRGWRGSSPCGFARIRSASRPRWRWSGMQVNNERVAVSTSIVRSSSIAESPQSWRTRGSLARRCYDQRHNRACDGLYQCCDSSQRGNCELKRRRGIIFIHPLRLAARPCVGQSSLCRLLILECSAEHCDESTLGPFA